MSQSPAPLKHLIAGEWIAGAGTPARSIDPADPGGAPVAEYTTATAEQLESAVSAAAGAAQTWDAMGILARGGVLRRAAELVTERAEELAVLMTREHGKTLGDSRLEVGATVETLHYHAEAARRPDGATYPSGSADEIVRTVRRPVGPVGVITPWNFPLQIPAWKIAPALLWGNPVVWKPASDTPAMAVAFAEILVDAGVPSGVLNLVLAPGSLGGALVAHPEIAAVTFTGSVEVGASIRDTVVPRGGRLQMELGGHNPAIVMPDANIANAATMAITAATNSTGQKCTATRRIIAVGDAYDELRAALIERVSALRVGRGLDDGTQVGPLISQRAADEVNASIEQAKREGAAVLATADVPETPGAWVQPTLFEGDPSLTICSEEVFGPVPVLLRAADLDAAIALANSTAFGLTASVFTRDEAAIRRCVNEVTAGIVKINAPSTGSEVHAPFGGLAASSFPAPREQASDSAAEFFSITKAAYYRLAPEA
ncbi:aldehyde dehydrogenase family protein [Leucobacter sp. GX24907]